MESSSLPAFVKYATSNINEPKKRFWPYVGTIDFGIGLLVYFLCIFLHVSGVLGWLIVGWAGLPRFRSSVYLVWMHACNFTQPRRICVSKSTGDEQDNYIRGILNRQTIKTRRRRKRKVDPPTISILSLFLPQIIVLVEVPVVRHSRFVLVNGVRYSRTRFRWKMNMSRMCSGPGISGLGSWQPRLQLLLW